MINFLWDVMGSFYLSFAFQSWSAFLLLNVLYLLGNDQLYTRTIWFYKLYGVLEIAKVFSGISEIVGIKLGKLSRWNFFHLLDKLGYTLTFVLDDGAFRLVKLEIRIYPHLHFSLSIYSTKPKLKSSIAEKWSHIWVSFQKRSQHEHWLRNGQLF